MASVATLYEHGTWLAQVQHRLTNFYFIAQKLFYYPNECLLFLLGVKFMRNEVFSPTDKGRLARQKLFKIGVFIGIPINLLIFILVGFLIYLFAIYVPLFYLLAILEF